MMAAGSPACVLGARHAGLRRIPRREPGRSERGAVTSLELVLLTPVFVVLLVFVAFCGRVGRTGQVVQHLASTAARAASIERSDGVAVGAATAAVSRGASDNDFACGPPSVAFQTTDGVRSVRVGVTCRVSLRGLGLLGIPGDRSFSATAVQPIDPYREG
jgi:Flp pilus assembly protein TadG